LDDEALFMREALAGKVDATGAAQPDIVSSGLECVRSWERRADADSPPGAPQRFVTWLLAQLRRGRLVLRPRATAPPVIHLLDSCQTRHAAEAAQALRNVCELLGIKIAAATSAARHVVCCGAAGGMPQMAPDSARRMAAARLCAADPAAVYVSADPRCVAHLRRAQQQRQTIFGVAEFVATFFDVTP
jgi:Fe-S oxidoreductase